MVKRKEKIELVRQKIIHGALKVFVKMGFYGASISQIAKAAEVSQGLIYHYFTDKVHLWKEVKKNTFEEANADPDFGASKVTNFKSFLETVVSERFKFYSDNPDLLTIIGWEKLQSPGTALFGTSGQFKGIWQKELREFQSSGEIRPDIDIDLLALIILSAVSGVFDYVPKLYDEQMRTKKQEQYLHLIIDGLYKAFVNKT